VLPSIPPGKHARYIAITVKAEPFTRSLISSPYGSPVLEQSETHGLRARRKIPMRLHELPSTLLIGLAVPAHAHEDLWHGKIQVLSPPVKKTYSSVPLEMRIRITGFDHDGDGDDNFHVRLNGNSITRQLGPFIRGVYRVLLYNHNLKPGRNRLTVKTQGEQAKVAFHRPKAASILGNASSQIYVPISTQVPARLPR
jgi:hypothetical protein